MCKDQAGLLCGEQQKLGARIHADNKAMWYPERFFLERKVLKNRLVSFYSFSHMM